MWYNLLPNLNRMSLKTESLKYLFVVIYQNMGKGEKILSNDSNMYFVFLLFFLDLLSMSEETCINDWRGPTRPFINGVVEAKKTQWWSTTQTSDGPGPCRAWGLTHPFGWVKPALGLEPRTLGQAQAWELTHHYWWCCCKNTRFPCLLHYMYLYFTLLSQKK